MEVTERADDLRRLLQLVGNHPELQIFVDEPPIVLEPSNSTHTTTFNDANLVQLFSKNYYHEVVPCSYHILRMCICMSLDGRLVYALSFSQFIVIDLFQRKVDKITLYSKWPFTETSNFLHWHLKVDKNRVFLYNNHDGSIYFMELDLTEHSIQLNAHFQFDSTRKEVHTCPQFTKNIPKKRLIQINGQRFLMLVRNEQDLPELELYSVTNFNKPLKSFQNIPNGRGLRECIKLDVDSICVLNFDWYGVLKDLTIIDIDSGEQKCISLNYELFSIGVRFLMDTSRYHNFSSIISQLEYGTPKGMFLRHRYRDGIVRDMFTQSFDVHSFCDFNHYLNGNMLLMLFIDCLGFWRQPTVLIARLNIETGQISRIVFDWPNIKESSVFKSHFIFDHGGRLRLLKVGIEADKVSFQINTVRGGGPDSLRHLSLLSVKCNYPKFFEHVSL